MSATVLIAEKNKLFLEALEYILPSLGFTVVGTTSDRSDCDTLALKTKPELLLYDLHLSRDGRAGLTHLKSLKEQLPELKILVVGFYEATDQLEAEILNAGFDGFVSKSGNRGEFIKKLNDFFP
jgi:DNA-binding NarL/FixJ family response regulator